MNPQVRRILSLTVVFAAAFALVFGMRLWHSGAWHSWLAQTGFAKNGAQFTLQDRAPLELDDVALLARLNSETAKLTRAVMPSVVSIHTAGIRTERLRDYRGRTRERHRPTQGQGSGVIVTREGHIITNHHVVADQQQIRVTLHGGTTHSAYLVGYDSLLDIAVLKIDADESFIPLKFGDSSSVEVGQMAFAVGSPFGLGETITQGIISAKERSLADNQRALFQTDAAINPGNSGGPLVNLRGEIIGINVAIYSSDRDNPGFMGVGFSIPSNDVRETLFQILERGRPTRGYLGVHMHDLDNSVRAALRFTGDHGVLVLSVLPGSPAQLAGLRPWDLILSFNGTEAHTAEQLILQVQRTRVGAEKNLHVWRQGEEIEVRATIIDSEEGARASQATSNARPETNGDDPASILRAIGMLVRNLDARERSRGLRGIVVSRLQEERIAASHLAIGDLIVAVNDTQIESAGDFLIHLAASASNQETRLLLIRNGQAMRVTLPEVDLQE